MAAIKLIVATAAAAVVLSQWKKNVRWGYSVGS